MPEVCRTLRSRRSASAIARRKLDQWNKVSGPLEISQSAFAIRLGLSFPRLNEIVRGKRGVTPDTALRLEPIRKASWKKRRSTGSEG